MSKRIPLLAALVGLAVVAALAAPGVGDRAVNFSLLDTAGREHRLADLENKADAVVLVWLSVQCPISNAYNADFQRVADELKDDEVTVLGIFSNRTESKEQVKAFVEQQGWSFPCLLDPGNQVADAYDANRTPETRVLNAKLTVKYTGAWTNNQDPRRATVHFAENAAKAVVAGRDPDPSSARAFGCTIKR